MTAGPRRGAFHAWAWPAAVIAALVFPALAGADDAAREFNASTNLAGARWTYGWTPALGGALTLYTARFDSNSVQHWRAVPNHLSYVSYNPTPSPKTMPGGVTIPGFGLSLQPGHTQWAMVRWTAPVAGTVDVVARFLVRSTNSTDRAIAVLRGSEVLFSRWINPAVHGNVAAMSVTIDLAAGESVDFAVGPADGSNFSDVTGLDATVNFRSEATAIGPVLAFGLDRFVAARWPGNAFESIAFDPVNRRIAGSGDIHDLCGNFLSDGPPGDKGLAWDPVTQTLWEVTSTRTVRRWNGATLLDTVFTVPLTFTVPVSGPDTLESVRGIAVDSSFVYFVDAGPDPGQLGSNAWFKFSRAGVPLKSSKATDLVENLDMDPDALVDDIVYSPHSSPVFPGKLLIALEHSGIQVVDTDGNFVDRFRWSQQKLRPRDANRQWGRLSAFAGIALDPLTGNLYLQDNDTGDAQVWVRLPRASSASYAVAIGSNQPWLYWPIAGCSMPLWNAVPGASLLFGLAYREPSRLAYSVDFGSSGDLYLVDPRSGIGARIGATGVSGIWGMAYDPGRDLLYGRTETSPTGQIVTIDPVTAETAPLPSAIGHYVTDIAFSTADSALYGVEGGSPAKLIRIDRDTGAGTVVGNTVTVRGLDYDPVSGKLLGVTFDPRLVSIDPATGAFQTLSTLAPGPNEGLAVITVPFDPSVLAADEPSLRVARTLRAWPNPARAAVAIEFEVERAAELAVAVFDVQGRRVRELEKKRFVAGIHRLRWDGLAEGGRIAAAGVYFLRVESDGHASVARVVRVP